MNKDITIEALEELAKVKNKAVKKLKSQVYNQSIEIAFLLGFIEQTGSKALFLEALESANPNNGYISQQTINNWLNYFETGSIIEKTAELAEQS